MKLIILTLVIVSNLFAQSFATSGNIGFGTFSGKSPNVSAFFFSLNNDLELPFITEQFGFRLGYLYGKKFEFFIPENRQGKYYSEIHSANLRIVLKQSISQNNKLFIEEAFGAAIIWDKIFKDEQEENYGSVFSFSVNYLINKTNFIGFGTEFAITFTNSNTMYGNLFFFYRLSI